MVAIGFDGGRKGVLAMFKHGVGVGTCEVAQLGVEIKEDRVGFPTTQGTDGSLVDARDEEGGGTPQAQVVGFDAFGWDVGDVVDGSGARRSLVVISRIVMLWGRPMGSK